MKKVKKKSSLKFPCGFDKNGNKFYPWVWDKSQQKKVPNENIISGDQCNLYFRGIPLCYVKSIKKTPYFRIKGDNNIQLIESDSPNNLTLAHRFIQNWIVNEKIIPIPPENNKILNPETCTEHYLDNDNCEIIYHKNGKQKFRTIQDFINDQSNFFKYPPKVIHLYDKAKNFPVVTIKREVLGKEISKFKSVYENLDEHGLQNFNKLKFDIVGFNNHSEPNIILEICVTNKVDNNKSTLLRLINVPSVELTVKEKELNLKDSSWYKKFDIYRLPIKWINNAVYHIKFEEIMPIIYQKLIDNNKVLNKNIEIYHFENEKKAFLMSHNELIYNKPNIEEPSIQDVSILKDENKEPETKEYVIQIKPKSFISSCIEAAKKLIRKIFCL